VLGSSTAAGAVAPSYAGSWAGLLTAAIRSKGVAVLNASVNGTRTASSLERFDRDVAPLAPDFVVLATSVMNESPFGDFPSLRRTYTQNTRLLIARVRAIGAIPIVVTPYPSDALNPALRQQMLEIAREFEAEGVTVWDFWHAMDDGAGRWLPGLSDDGVHVGLVGHLHLFESIPLGFFDFALTPFRPLPPRQGFGSWIAAPGSAPPPAIQVTPASAAPSWSAAFWTRAGRDSEAKALLEIAGPGASLRRTGKRYELLLSGEVVTAGEASESPDFQHICLTYQALSGTLTLYVNGARAGGVAATGAAPARRFTWGPTSLSPGIAGESFSQILIYRSPLRLEDIRELATGRTPSSSLEAFLPLGQAPAHPNQNAAPTVVEILITGEWLWAPDGPRVLAVQ
jgi:lysophospholipase L1-like esterase